MLCELRAKIEPCTLTLLRVTVGIIMATHGWGKLQDISMFAALLNDLGLPHPLINAYMATAAEFLGGLGLIVGLATPIASAGIIATMSVAIYKVHWKYGLMHEDGGFEYPLILLVVSLFFMIKGGGVLSLDHLFAKKFCKKNTDQ